MIMWSYTYCKCKIFYNLTNNFKLFIIGPNGTESACCYNTHLINKTVEIDYQYLQLPTITDIGKLQLNIANRLDKCKLINTDSQISVCDKNIECEPLTEGWELFMKSHFNISIMVPIFKINEKFFGTNLLTIFEIDLQDFLLLNNLVYQNHHNDSFSYLFIYKQNLITFSRVTSKIICQQNNNQLSINKHMTSLANKIFKNLDFFRNLYEIKKTRPKRNSMSNTWISSLFFSDSQDLTSIHTRFNEFLDYSNHNVLIEKGLMKKIELNEEKLVKLLHKQEIEQWFAKFQSLKLRKLESINTQLLLFINSLNGLNQELSEYKNLINWILIQDANKVNCLNKLGCFKNSKIIFDNKNITIQLEKIQMSPELVTYTTCPFYNDSHVYASHQQINVKNNCYKTRPVKDTDFFYNKQILLIIQNDSYSFSCAKPLTIFVINIEFHCELFSHWPAQISHSTYLSPI